ncbi:MULTISPECIES: Crp/Fnr family transcriptional regulator [unclassified Rhizobium]|uniref:Crp/Fnr family transcriptional regulator n=1 Tax=unclassified Rhizobium TaxID=2613769 RepID=UPI00160E503A|nr:MULTISPECIES: Crp/Fnr family transcriptional regulator [unclassified Rhizobium]MBB3545163.1 CRP/FNR family transcriptional regulator [Rhizobium sp. BK399]MCS3743577.1 CRP/FNR family transcriptional regulator [Rhizobium sp. BK661]MCS4096537.1 CRP/FNR family transcriptional regulator [Rhizobium sp. BK176]
MLANIRPLFQEAAAIREPCTLATLFDRSPLEHATAGQIVFFEGDRALHLFAIREGNLRVCRQLHDGRRVITGFLTKGDIVGVSFKNRYLYSAEALDDVHFQRQTKVAFDQQLLARPDLRPILLSQLCDEVAAAQDQMVLLSCKSAEERLCSFLLAQLHKSTSLGFARDVISLPMTRLDIADYLGLTIETVSRTVTKLAGQGILSTGRRHEIRVLKKSALVLRAGEGDADVDNELNDTLRCCRH